MGQASTETRNAALDAVNALLNGGTVEIRTGTPAAVNSTPTGSVLATFTLPSTAFAAASAGSSAANLPADVSATGAGTAGHYVAKTSGGAVRRNGVVGVEMTINSTTIASGDAISMTSFTYAQAEGTN